jgi:hypothetical protein
LVPENDDGNVEYKLQLLSPSPARFARLVTQMKWRLLEGGGQAYYELGVADSGALVGLPRKQLEESLETLEMMAGEIGASVIVVKEIEVPKYLADVAASETERERWKGSGRRKRRGNGGAAATDETDSSTAAPSSWSTTTETETSPNTDQDDEEEEDLSTTVVLEKPNHRPLPGTSPLRNSAIPFGNGTLAAGRNHDDSDPDPADVADAEDDDPPLTLKNGQISIDLEISTVYKPRPMRARMVHPPNTANTQGGGKQKRMKKIKHIVAPQNTSIPGEIDAQKKVGHTRGGHAGVKDSVTKAQFRREARDRRRDEKRQALIAIAEKATAGANKAGHSKTDENVKETAHLVEDLTNLHVSVSTPTVEASPAIFSGFVPENHTNASDSVLDTQTDTAAEEDNDDDDVFASPLSTAKPPFASFSHGVERLGAQGDDILGQMDDVDGEEKTGNRLIVEALVVRKMSLDEGFLDFGGFSLI